MFLLKNEIYHRRNDIFNIILFIIWPFLGFLSSLRNINNKVNRKLIMIFFAIYGLTFVINLSSDSERRAIKLEESYKEPSITFYSTITNLYKEGVDIIEPFLFYLVSQVTGYAGILFAIYSLIFGGLLLYYIRFMNNIYKNKITFTATTFFILLIFTNFINEINGFRMWAALWMYSVGIMLYLKNKSKKSYVFILLSVFTHFSFILSVLVFVIYRIFGNKPLIYGIIAIITLFFVEFNLNIIPEYALLIGPAVEKKAIAYTNEEYLENLKDNRNNSAWFMKLNDKGLLYLTVINLIIMYANKRGKFVNELLNNYFSFSLIVLSFANIVSQIPTAGRFYRMFYIFAFSTIVLYYVYEKKKYYEKYLNIIGLPLILLSIGISLRIFITTSSAYLFGPIFLLPYSFINNLSLYSLLIE